MLATPWGFRDILPEEALAREDIADTVRGVLRAEGYLPVETPLVEDKAALEAGGRIADTPFKLFDDDGRLLVVRPDNTLSVARLVAARMRGAELPLRLRYEAPVVRERARLTGGSRQFTQLGYELIGLGGAAGDAEVVRLAARALRELGLGDARIVCGSVRPFTELLAAAGDRSLAADALALVHANNLVDLDVRVAEAGLSPAMARAICGLPRLAGGMEALDQADELLQTAGVATEGIAELRDLARELEQADAELPAGALAFDFSIMNSFNYYTGLVLKVYAGNLSDPVGSGGRYDTIFDDSLGATAGTGGRVPAAGFAFSLERLAGACQARREAVSVAVEGAVARTAEAPLRIAVPKGSLFAGTIEVLAAAGLDTTELCEPGRRLIVPGRDVAVPGAGSAADAATAGDPGASEATVAIGNVEFVIVRATDAPAFVACGGADCGFCGRDSLIEAELDLLELVDMGYGACRFIEAEPADRAGEAERAYARRGSLRVATKYPKIASRWYESRGITADIVALHGNIELGPIVGLADRIVDITATGTTLRENNLVITGELLSCTARFFVNPGRARLDPRVRELGARLARVAAARTVQ